MPIKVQMDGTRKVIFSYSAYSSYLQCPLRYKREKIDRDKVQEDKSFALPGTIVHNAAELYLKNKVDERIFQETTIRTAVAKHCLDPGVDLIKAYGSVAKAADMTVKCADNLYTFYTLRKIKLKPYYCEYWFGTWDNPLEISNLVGLQGAGDLLEIVSPGAAILYDYKATWSDKNLNKDQLILYSMALERVLGVKINMAAFYLLPLNKTVYISVTDTAKEELVTRLNAAAVEILAGNFEPTPNVNCYKCLYYFDCPHAMQEESKKIKDQPKEKSSFEGFNTFNL